MASGDNAVMTVSTFTHKLIMVSQYELERERNIRRNNEILRALDVKSSVDNLGIMRSEMKDSSTLRSRPLKRKRVTETGVSNIPSRKSTRLMRMQSRDNHSTDTSEDVPSYNTDATPEKQVVSLRSIHTPRTLPREVDPKTFDTGYRAPPPQRDTDGGTLHFEPEYHDFTPNLTPSEVLELGSFGGTFFRPFYSRVLNHHIPADFDEFPEDWFRPSPNSGLSKPDNITKMDYDRKLNAYKVKAGQSLEEWEKSGWIQPQDPRGWFQWYCRFYLGRRSEDDSRQINRWRGCCGPSGRFKRSLIKAIASRGGKWNDMEISPVIRQTLQHWAYRLTEEDYDEQVS